MRIGGFSLYLAFVRSQKKKCLDSRFSHFSWKGSNMKQSCMLSCVGIASLNEW